MALGSTNAPGIAGKDAAEAKKLAAAANKTANEAKTAAENAEEQATAAKTAAQKAAADMEKINQAIEEGGGSLGGGGGGNTIKITFEEAFVGQPYTVTGGDDTITGIVPESGVVSVKATNSNTIYTITATASNGLEYSDTVTTGQYYGQYTAALSAFNATIHVTTEAGAEVTATLENDVFAATADSSGTAVLHVNRAGIYTITAAKDGAASGNTSVAVENQETTYTTAVRFLVLKVTSPPGSVITIRRKE